MILFTVALVIWNVSQYFTRSVAKNQNLQQFNIGTFKNCKETIIVRSCQTYRVKQNKKSTTLFFWGHENCKAILKLDPNYFQDVLNLFMRYHARFCYKKSPFVACENVFSHPYSHSFKRKNFVPIHVHVSVKYFFLFWNRFQENLIFFKTFGT